MQVIPYVISYTCVKDSIKITSFRYTLKCILYCKNHTPMSSIISRKLKLFFLLINSLLRLHFFGKHFNIWLLHDGP